MTCSIGSTPRLPGLPKRRLAQGVAGLGDRRVHVGALGIRQRRADAHPQAPASPLNQRAARSEGVMPLPGQDSRDMAVAQWPWWTELSASTVRARKGLVVARRRRGGSRPGCFCATQVRKVFCAASA